MTPASLVPSLTTSAVHDNGHVSNVNGKNITNGTDIATNIMSVSTATIASNDSRVAQVLLSVDDIRGARAQLHSAIIDCNDALTIVDQHITTLVSVISVLSYSR